MRASARPSCWPGPTSASATRTSTPDTAPRSDDELGDPRGCDSTARRARAAGILHCRRTTLPVRCRSHSIRYRRRGAASRKRRASRQVAPPPARVRQPTEIPRERRASSMTFVKNVRGTARGREPADARSSERARGRCAMRRVDAIVRMGDVGLLRAVAWRSLPTATLAILAAPESCAHASRKNASACPPGTGYRRCDLVPPSVSTSGQDESGEGHHRYAPERWEGTPPRRDLVGQRVGITPVGAPPAANMAPTAGSASRPTPR